MKIILALNCCAALIYIAVTWVPFQNSTGLTIHLAGDSTLAVQQKSKRPATGWGEPFAWMLCDGVSVVNHAKNGRSTKSFQSEGVWNSLLQNLQTDDIVMIQFGHNDQKIHDPTLYTRPWHEYKENLQFFVEEVRERNAEPLLLTPIARRVFDTNGKHVQTLEEYPAVTRAVANAMKVKFIDLNATTRELIAAMGSTQSKALFVHLAPGVNENYLQGIQDDTHLNSQGALQVATLVATELRKTRPDLICH